MKNKIQKITIVAISVIIVILMLLVKVMFEPVYADDSPNIQEGWYNNYEYTGNEQVFEVPKTGEYLLEVWGAQGGATREGIGGKGGYSYGKVFLNAGEKLYIQVGGNGLNHLGYNGGGMGEREKDNTYNYGGGASHIAINSGLLMHLENVNDKVLIVAGGGGGGERPNVSGGAGGGGNSDGQPGGAWEGYIDGEYFNYTEFVAEGGKQYEGGKYGNNYDNWSESKGMPGTFGKGGDAYDHQYALNNDYMENGFKDYGGGGGSGWYGGGGIDWAGGGGGGSGHLSDKLYECGGDNGVRYGDGYAKITFLKIAECQIKVKYLKYDPNNDIWNEINEDIYNRISVGSSFNVPNGNCPWGYHLDRKDIDIYYVTENKTINVYYYPNKVFLDVNGELDGIYSGELTGYGTFDLYISGNKVASNVDDYYNTELLYGQSFEIKNITANTGRSYSGVIEGSLSGYLTDNVNVRLRFRTKEYLQTTHHYLYNARTKEWEEWLIDYDDTLYGDKYVPVYQDPPDGYYGYYKSQETEVTITCDNDFYVYYYPKSFTLDVNGYLDGEYFGWIDGYGSFDIYINDTLVNQGVSDFYSTDLLYGQTYSIKNIIAYDGHKYNGVYNGYLEGNITDNTYVELSFETLSYTQTVNHYKWNAINSAWDYWTSVSENIKYGNVYVPQYKEAPTGYHTHSRSYDSGKVVTNEYTYGVYYYPNTYTITFDANGGNCEYITKEILFGGYVGSLPYAMREGCELKGWFVTPHLFINDANVDENVNEYTVYNQTENTTIYAGWKDITAPQIEIKPANQLSSDFEILWKNNPVNINVIVTDTGFAGIEKVLIESIDESKVLLERNYAGETMNDQINITIGNKEKFIYEGEYLWKIIVIDKAGNKSEKSFKTKLDYTPPVIMDIDGEFDSNGRLLTQTAYQYFDKDNFIWQKAFDEKESVNVVSGVKEITLSYISNPDLYIDDVKTPNIKSAPFEIKYDFNKNTDNEFGILLCAKDYAGNESVRVIVTTNGFNRMFRRVMPRENYD